MSPSGHSFPLFVMLESLPGAGIPGSVQDCWPLVTLECCGDLSLFPSSSPGLWGNRDLKQRSARTPVLALKEVVLEYPLVPESHAGKHVN